MRLIHSPVGGFGHAGRIPLPEAYRRPVDRRRFI
jgi:hypothetical protein